MIRVPEFAIRLTSNDDGYDVWEIMQLCIGQTYYVTIGDAATETEAREAIAQLEGEMTPRRPSS